MTAVTLSSRHHGAHSTARHRIEFCQRPGRGAFPPLLLLAVQPRKLHNIICTGLRFGTQTMLSLPRFSTVRESTSRWISVYCLSMAIHSINKRSLSTDNLLFHLPLFLLS